MIRIDSAFFRANFPERKKDAHKGDFGKVLIFAGSCGMAGAAVLAGRAALRSGAGLVRFLIPSFADPIYPVLQTAVPEATCVTPESIGFYSASEKAGEVLSEYSSIAAGSGLGNDAERMQILSFLIRNYSGILVLDADALNAIARGDIPQEVVISSPAERILTPHIGEAKRLLSDTRPIRTEKERISAVQKLSEMYQSNVLLKGHETLIFSASGNLYRNTTGGPGMATGGSGDVLSGIIAAFAGQGLPAEKAAASGAFIHGKAGDLAAAALGEVCMNAGDIITFLPEAWKA